MSSSRNRQHTWNLNSSRYGRFLIDGVLFTVVSLYAEQVHRLFVGVTVIAMFFVVHVSKSSFANQEWSIRDVGRLLVYKQTLR